MLTLKKNYEFQKVFKKGTWYGGDFMSLYVVANQKKSNYLGICVSKKCFKSSVKRNRIRRLLKESYRLNDGKIQKGFDVVIVWKTNISFEEANFYNIQKDCMKIIVGRVGRIIHPAMLSVFLSTPNYWVATSFFPCSM